MLGLRTGRAFVIASTLALAVTVPIGVGDEPASASAQDDGGSGGDAGDTFDEATAIDPVGAHRGSLDRSGGDRDDFYRFTLARGASTSMLVTFEGGLSEPVTLLDPRRVPVDAGAGVLGSGVTLSGAATTQLGGVRLTVHRALVPGEYRLHLSARRVDVGGYELCFMNCEGPVDAPIDLIFGGSLPSPETEVLLVPPSHGDLGNPAGPGVRDYIDATLRGMHRWEEVLDTFADDYPQYSYLADITVDVEIFDGIGPLDPSGYDVVVGYVAAGPVFRGVASNSGEILRHLVDWGGNPDVRFTGRLIALSLFGASPRAGQVLYDFPEISDLESVTMHEFAHTFGLGHTRTWHPELGPDLMNSPATFVYGDGSAVGDGGERTATNCFSTLDLKGMAELYRWLPSGEWEPSYGQTELPDDIPYALYC